MFFLKCLLIKFHLNPNIAHLRYNIAHKLLNIARSGHIIAQAQSYYRVFHTSRKIYYGNHW